MSALPNVDLGKCAARQWADDLDLEIGPSRVIGLLVHLMDADRLVHASQLALAERAHVSKRSIVTWLSVLARAGLITRQSGGSLGRGKGRSADVIVVNVHADAVAMCKVDRAPNATPLKHDAINALCKQTEKQTKSTDRGVTSPAPRARGLDNHLGLVSSSEPKGSSEDICRFPEFENQPARSKSKPEPVDEAVAAYRDRARELGWVVPRETTITAKKRAAIASLLKLHGGLDAWLEVLDAISADAWVNDPGKRAGTKHENFKMTIDYLLAETNFTRRLDEAGHAKPAVVDWAKRYAYAETKGWQDERWGPPPGHPDHEGPKRRPTLEMSA